MRWALAAALILPATAAHSQPFPPGYVDPAPILAAANRAIGADRIRCLTASGSAYGGRRGQQRYVKVEGDWPINTLSNFSRTMNWQTGAMRESFDRAPGQTPASYKYGAGWTGGTPLQRQTRQVFAVNGRTAWHRDGAEGAFGRIDPAIAEMWQLDLWLNPVGFLKAAALPGANPAAAWRWEIGEAGRDGPTVKPERVNVVSITMLGKYRVDATINPRGLIQRVHTRVAHPVLGDLNVEHEFTDDAYADLGQGMRFPTTWHSHQGYDDNYNTQTVSSGHNAFGGTLADIKVNDCADAVAVPARLPAFPDPARIATQRLAGDVWLIGGTTHNSVAIGFADHVAVVEAPLSEAPSLAVIAEVGRLFPNKPIRFLVNTHQHFDHIGGLRTYHHVGATIVTHARNHDFYNRDVVNYTPRTIAPDLLSIMPTTELTEGYTYELVRQNYTLSDGKRRAVVHYVQPLDEAEGMLMVVLPEEKLVVQADLIDTHEPLPTRATDGAKALFKMVGAFGYDIDRIVPIHGAPIAWREFVARSGVGRPVGAGGALTLDSPIEAIAANARGRAILDALMPGLTNHPSMKASRAPRCVSSSPTRAAKSATPNSRRWRPILRI